MKARSINMARLFGLVMIVLIGAWDVDAMRPHIAVHSWYTLMLVCLFLVAHVGDYLTVGRLIHRFDPLVLANLENLGSSGPFLIDDRTPETASARFFLRQSVHNAWHGLFAYQQPPSLVPRQTAKLYAFTIMQAEAAQAVNASTVMRPRYTVVPVD